MDYLGYKQLETKADQTLHVLHGLRNRYPDPSPGYQNLSDAIHYVTSQKKTIQKLVDQVRLEQSRRADILKLLLDVESFPG